MLKIVQAATDTEIDHIRNLFQEYELSLGFDLHFQGFDRELATLPGEYAAPNGRLLIATWDDQTAGCVALRRIEPRICEMKRLYVRPKYRRHRIGRALAETLIGLARSVGYERMRLDTIDWMAEAIALYRLLGFVRIGPYRFNPFDNAVFMELDLTGQTSGD